MRKLNLLHLNAGTCLGGTETMILRFLDKVDQNRFQVYVGAFFPGGELINEAEKRGAQSILFKITNSVNPVQLFSAFVKLYRFLKKNKIDIIHMYGFWTNIGGRIAAKLAKTPIVITGQRTEDNWRKPIHSFLDRFTSRWVDLYISVFNKGKELLIKRERIPEEKIVVVHNGIDLNWTLIEPQINTDEHKNQFNKSGSAKPTIGMIAAFSSFKAHQELIQAVPKIIKKFPNAKFILVGKGKTEKKITELIKELDLNSCFFMPGNVFDVRPVLSRVSVFVLISHTEGCPVSVLEAMAFGLPVVASRVGGIPEIVDDGITGILVESGHPDQIASAIIGLLENPEKARMMGEKARKRIKSEFTIEQMMSKIESSYIKLAENKGLV